MSKLASGSGTSSALAWMSGKSTPASAIRFRACSSWRSELSSPTGRAPCFARRIDHCAAPQPNSSTSLPATSSKTFSSDSGICQTPQRGSGRLMKSRCRSWYSSLCRSQNNRFRSASSDGFAGNPDLLGRPAASPLRRHEVVVPVVLRVVGSQPLVERLDLEAVPPKDANHLAVREVVVHALVLTRPLDSPEVRVRPHEAL